MENQNLNNEKTVKINCDFCDKEIECPEEMLEKSKKQMCYDCFIEREPSDKELKDVHVDIPMDKMPAVISSNLADYMVEEEFPDLWNEKKNELKELSKKDLALEMFGAGVYLGVKSFMESTANFSKEMGNDEDEEKPAE